MRDSIATLSLSEENIFFNNTLNTDNCTEELCLVQILIGLSELLEANTE